MIELGEAAVQLRRAAAGDERAWRIVVDTYAPMVWGVSRAFTREPADAEDVCQMTWLSLAENLDELRDPQRLSGWLVTTARREAIRLSRARQRESPIGLDSGDYAPPEHAEAAEHHALRLDGGTRLGKAFGQLPPRCQQLLRVLAVAPDTSYSQVSESLGIPVGTIGPRRSRCLTELRRRLLSAGLPEEAVG